MRSVESLQEFQGDPTSRRDLIEHIKNQYNYFIRGIHPKITWGNNAFVNYMSTLPFLQYCIELKKGGNSFTFKITCLGRNDLLYSDDRGEQIFWHQAISPRTDLPQGKMHINVNYYNWVWLMENFLAFMYDPRYRSITRYIEQFKFVLSAMNSGLVDLPMASSKKQRKDKLTFEDYMARMSSSLFPNGDKTNMTKSKFSDIIGRGAFLVVYIYDLGDGVSFESKCMLIAKTFYSFLEQRYSSQELNAVKPDIKPFAQVSILPKTKLFSIGYGIQKLFKLDCLDKINNINSFIGTTPAFQNQQYLHLPSDIYGSLLSFYRHFSEIEIKPAEKFHCAGKPFSHPGNFENKTLDSGRKEYPCFEQYNLDQNITGIDPNDENNFVCKKVDGKYFKFCNHENCFTYPSNITEDKLKHLKLLKTMSPSMVRSLKNLLSKSRNKLQTKREVSNVLNSMVDQIKTSKNSFGKLQRMSKKRKLRITKKVHGKRVYKTKHELEKQLKMFF